MTALAVFFVLYWGAINYLLNRGEPIKFTSKNTKVEIKVESGWSVWPGVLHANGAFVQVQDYNIELQIEATRAVLDFAPTSALKGIVHIESLLARGTRLRMLARVKDGNASRLRIAAFPPLSDRPSYYDAPRKSPPNPAKIRIDEIDGELRELWMMEYHAEGKIRASGTVEVLDDVKISDAQVDMNDVTIHVGDKLFAESFTTSIQASIGPFPALKPTAKQALTSIEADVKLDMQVRDLSIVELYSPDGPLRLEGGSHVNLNLKAKEGQILESSTGKLESSNIEAALKGQVFPFALDVEFSTPTQDELQVAGNITGNESDGQAPYVWGAKSIQIDAELAQPKSLSLQLKSGEIDWEGATLSDPSFIRKVGEDDGLPLIKVSDFSGGLQVKKSPERTELSLDDASGQFSVFPAEKMSVGCQLEASGHCSQQDKTWACSDIEASCEPVAITREGSSATMSVRLEAPQLAREAKGTWNSTIHFSGSNPKDILLDVAASSVLEKIGAAAAPLGPLSGSVSVAYVPAEQGPATIVGDLSRFESGALSLQGHLVNAQSLKSQWIAELGAFKVGVKQSHKGVELELDPPASWLETN